MKLAEGLKAGPHTLMLMARGMDEHQSRWSPPLVASLTFLGLDPAGGKLLDPLPEWGKPKLKMEILGDSITEGVVVHGEREGKKTWPWRTDGRLAYSAQTAMRLGAEWRQVGFGAGPHPRRQRGFAGRARRLQLLLQGLPADDWQPDLVVINQGTNDGGASADNFRPLYRKYLVMIGHAYPKAKIAAMRPFNGAHAADIKAEVEARNAAGDMDIFYVDTTGWLGRKGTSPTASTPTSEAAPKPPTSSRRR